MKRPYCTPRGYMRFCCQLQHLPPAPLRAVRARCRPRRRKPPRTSQSRSLFRGKNRRHVVHAYTARCNPPVRYFWLSRGSISYFPRRRARGPPPHGIRRESRTATTRRRRVLVPASTHMPMRPRPDNTRKVDAEGRNSQSHGPERGETKRRRRPGHQRTPHAARFLVGPSACVRARPPRRPTRLTLIHAASTVPDAEQQSQRTLCAGRGDSRVGTPASIPSTAHGGV